ncbi:MAG: sigma-70 family RNA polymerase sigma factor [Actinomycetota bacterium]
MTTPTDASASLFQAMRTAPMLDAEEEIRLARAAREGDAKARDVLVRAHLRLVAKTAMQFRGYGLSVQDLVAEGNLGLVRALDTFDPERGLRFATYALWWVRAAMFEHVLRFSTPVAFGLSTERKRLFFKLKGMKAKLGAGGALAPAEAAEIGRALDAKDHRVVEMERLLAHPVRSLDAPVTEGGATLGELLADEAPAIDEVLGERQELMYRRELLKSAMTRLTDREQDIVKGRTLRDKPLKLEELASRWGISRERVRQIEAAAMAKLRGLVARPAAV